MRSWAIPAWAGMVLGLAGCSTPGPLHVYSVAERGDSIHDVAIDADHAADDPSYVAAHETVVGFAYDPYTDHFFLRLAPGDRMRVVDRPARKIKREFPIEGALASGGGDMAICPREGHVFILEPNQASVLEVTRFGAFVRRLEFGENGLPAIAIAFDMERGQLLLLERDGRTVEIRDRNGKSLQQLKLARTVEPTLAFDSTRTELYAPLRDEPNEVGVFNAQGELARTVRIHPGDQYIDVGPHSFLRVF